MTKIVIVSIKIEKLFCWTENVENGFQKYYHYHTIFGPYTYIGLSSETMRNVAKFV